MKTLLRLLFIPAILAGLGGVSHAAEAQRPNVIIVLSDDQGYGDFSCHGNPVLKTPNLDKLHDQSIRFTDFHVAPMCTPTRGQLMTGLDALRNGATSVCAGRSFVRRGIPTMAEIFAASGYDTALFGKWHLGDSYPNLPNDRGFQEAVYHLGWGITSMADLWQNDYFNPHARHNGIIEQFKGYCTDTWFDLALNWISQRRKRKEPFFLYLPTNAPHSPHWVPEKYKRLYADTGPAAKFFGMIANLDENMGRLEALLQETGLRDNTIVIFMNDNGGTAGVQIFNAGMRGRKEQYYDGGHRAACFVRWPAGRLRSPCDIDALTQVQDLLPTLIDTCGLNRPATTKFDGLSLVKLLRGETNALPDRKLVVQYGPCPEKWDSAVMWDKWRFVKGEELYDLRADPGQMTNVYARHPDVFKQMKNHYEDWWAGVAPTLDDFRPISIGSDKENPVTLSAADWANVYCDNLQDLRKGVNKNGEWHVLVERGGQYEISLRRWPKEADAPIAGGVPAFNAADGVFAPGKALPIAKARLKIANLDSTQPVGSTDKEVTFNVSLNAGTKLPMQTWFYDADGKQVCGAYFVYVQRH